MISISSNIYRAQEVGSSHDLARGKSYKEFE